MRFVGPQIPITKMADENAKYMGAPRTLKFKV